MVAAFSSLRSTQKWSAVGHGLLQTSIAFPPGSRVRIVSQSEASEAQTLRSIEEGHMTARTPSTLFEIVRTIQDVARTDEEVVAVMAYLFSSRQIRWAQLTR